MQTSLPNFYASADFTELNQRMLEPVLSYNRLALRLQGMLLQQSLAWFESCVEFGARQLEAWTSAREPSALLSLQAEAGAEFGERALSAAREMLDLQCEAQEEVSQWAEDGIKAVQEQVASAVAETRGAAVAAPVPAPAAPAVASRPATSPAPDAAPKPVRKTAAKATAARKPAPAKSVAAEKPARRTSTRAKKAS